MRLTIPNGEAIERQRHLKPLTKKMKPWRNYVMLRKANLDINPELRVVKGKMGGNLFYHVLLGLRFGEWAA